MADGSCILCLCTSWSVEAGLPLLWLLLLLLLSPLPPYYTVGLIPSTPRPSTLVLQVLVQDLVLKWRSAKSGPAAADGSNDLEDSRPSLAQRLGSLTPFRSASGRGAPRGERAASLAKLGGSRAGLAEREASLLGPADQRSDAPHTV